MAQRASCSRKTIVALEAGEKCSVMYGF
ncbi:hypothetical protein ACUN0G_15410 [Pseudomonas sp. 32A]